MRGEPSSLQVFLRQFEVLLSQRLKGHDDAATVQIARQIDEQMPVLGDLAFHSYGRLHLRISGEQTTMGVLHARHRDAARGVLPCFLVMDQHRLAEERSVAYHRAIAERLEGEREILENARRRVQGWLASADEAPFYARSWAEVLAGDTSSIAAFLVERSELADELRQSSPFAGALRPAERWKIWRETRERFYRR